MKNKFFEKKTVVILVLLATMFVGCIYGTSLNADSLANPTTVISIFPDQNLANKVAKQLDKSINDVVTQTELDQISTLNASRSNVQSIEGIQYLNHLTTLNLEVNSISDVTKVGGLTQLRTLNLYQNKISDISVLANLGNLQSLTISSNTITNLSPLSNLPALTYLDVSSNNGASLVSIASNTSLQSLLADNVGASDISMLQSLTNLQQLSLKSNQINDVSSLQNLQAMQTLYLDNNNIADISILANLAQMKQLSINNNVIQDVSVVRMMPSLNRLQISNNKVTDLEPVRNLIALTYLEFNVTGVTDISAVENLTNLTYLSFNLCYNRVNDLSPVRNLTKLVDLHFNGNAIQDLSPLLNLTKIQTLWMTDNEIDSIDQIKNIQGLKRIYFDQNNISDISVLTNMNTNSLEWINGGSNYITDISPLSAIQNPYTSIIYFKDQRATIPAQETQRTSIETPNVSIDLDGVSAITTYEPLSAGAIQSQYPLMVNGTPSATEPSILWDNLDVGQYTGAYKVVKNEPFLFGTLYYSLIVDQNINVRAPHRVTYHANGGTIGVAPVDNQVYIDGENAIVLDHGDLGSSNATFLEWNTQADGNGDSYSAMDRVLGLQGNVELYAIWKPNLIIPEIIPPKEIPKVEKKDSILVFVESNTVDTADSSNATALYGALALSTLVLLMKRRKNKE